MNEIRYTCKFRIVALSEHEVYFIPIRKILNPVFKEFSASLKIEGERVQPFVAWSSIARSLEGIRYVYATPLITNLTL